MFDEYEDLISIEDLCNILSIGKNTTYTLLRQKKIKAFRIGRKWIIPKKSVEDYILTKSKLMKPTNLQS